MWNKLNKHHISVTMKLLISLLLLNVYLGESVMVCYYSSWSVYWPEPGRYQIEDIDPYLCTHMLYAFAGLDSSTYEIRVLDPWNDLCDDYGKCGFQRFNKLKKKNPDLKTILAVGGWNEGSVKYSQMAADPAKRAAFVSSSVALLLEHGFDGLDLDWEYPANRGGDPADKENFPLLLNELYTALHAEGMTLSAAIPAGKSNIDSGYKMPDVANNLDFLHLMTYDLHGAWDKYTHHHTILYPYPEDEGENRYLNVDWAVNYWLELGTPKQKLVMGAALYDRCWRVDHLDNVGMYAPASQAGQAGPYTRTNGYLTYLEICESKSTNDWTTVLEPSMNEPYRYCPTCNQIWCSGEDPDSIGVKGQYAKDNEIGGVMIWSIESDDWDGRFSSRKYPLIRSLFENFYGGALPTRPPTLSPPPPTTEPPPPTIPPSEHCSSIGMAPDNEDCTGFYDCTVNSDGQYTENRVTCGSGLLFDPDTLICDWPENVCGEPDVCPNNC